MVVALGLLVNAVLVGIPVGGCVGALMGIDAHRAANGQKPLFTGGDTDDGISTGGGSSGGNSGSDSTGGGGGGHHTVTNNGVSSTQYCNRSIGISPPSKSEQYTLNPNQWGVTSTSTGNGLCMNVTTFVNETYPTQTAPEFSITWQFDPGPETAPVHGYPNIRVDDVLPKAMDTISELYLDLHWTYGVGDEIAESTDVEALAAETLATNVAIDMFLDTDADKAKNETNAKFEVMVWFWMSNEIAQPHGWGSPVINRTLEGTKFTLYTGQNDNGQLVLSWVADTILERFTGDIYPLITDLYNLEGSTYPAKDDYLGSLSFGTETYSVDHNVTFWAEEYKIDIRS
ncbi:CAZyme family GH12 [Penicillium roqueforti]|uniref:CAZyme family GH12 n=1 Tax=Penicillium roqueforti TaxID=5082 RepID=UPI00190B1B29|nr:CAZyme family GH12 [Penicillium roqueforti]KAF9245485.1 CAZyme family GH12 [Penicillium roqueforti]KAI1832887.1 CAZyme family GH12 [Penicillium roqueforti]KAI2672027.1 CAZyme family GH12 [Penicillium roqueforti]KAI2697087.1 CAZyme family GH12 [Penicillium roqueforti]KAI2723926.1 CAZyme family GH12 [Penicillium roqueforti]